MNRGEIWSVAGGPDYAGKPRPAIILQSDRFDATLSITICPVTTTILDATPARFELIPSETNGLEEISHVMTDKIATVPKSKLREFVGHLNAADIVQLNRHVALFVGLADPAEPIGPLPSD